jgi:hypothetical protein
MKKLLFIALAVLVLSACGNSDNTEKAKTIQFAPPVAKADAEVLADKDAAPENESAAAKPMLDVSMKEVAGNAAPATAITETEKKIIKEGDISFETGDVAETRKLILASLKKQGGYVENDSESTNGDENRKDYTINIRVPAKNFDAFLGNVSATATKIDSKNIRMSDVTAQFIDVKTRLDNKKLLEARYLDLLKKATKMADLLEIESKLSEIRSDIESTQGQLNYMSKQVAYSSLSITFYTKNTTQVAAGNGFAYKFKQALAGGWSFIQSFFFGIIALWPLWLAIFVAILLLRRWGKRNTYKE